MNNRNSWFRAGTAGSRMLLVAGIILLLFVLKPLLFPAAAAIPGDPADAGTQAVGDGLSKFWSYTGFANFLWGNLVMIIVGLVFIYLAIKYEYEPLLLVPIGTGIIVGNIPFLHGANLQVGIYEPGSVLNYLYFGVIKGIYPPLIFLGIGAMTDFSSLISNPKLILLGAAAQLGIFITFLGALVLGFYPPEAAAIGIIGGADGPTEIFL